jgi:hypothetical protein
VNTLEKSILNHVYVTRQSELQAVLQRSDRLRDRDLDAVDRSDVARVRGSDRLSAASRLSPTQASPHVSPAVAGCGRFRTVAARRPPCQ